MDDSKIANLGAANKNLSGNAVTVHFFGTHDFARFVYCRLGIMFWVF